MTALARLPPPVRPGARVGVAALSGPVDPRRLEAGRAQLEALGFEPVLASNLATGARGAGGLFAGEDGERLAAFHELAADPSLAAIFFARGGHGVLRLLPAIDWRLLAQTPRAYVGYSDVTPLLNGIVRRLRLVTFHGPMVAVELAAEPTLEERESLLAALAGETGARLAVTGGVRSEVVEGPLVGGCLSLLTAVVGSGHEVRAAGSILFWEDVEEPLFRIDRMLTQLRLSGSLAGLHGMVVGRPYSGDGRSEIEGLPEILLDLERELGAPVVRGCSSGHCRPNLTLPLGMNARLDPRGGVLSLG